MIQAKLKVIGGKHHGKLIPLNESKFLIGREEDCQLRPNSELVSRHHCVITTDQYSVHIRDLGSTNGTLVNNQRIRGLVQLRAGDQIRVGKIDLEVVVTQRGDGTAQPASGGSGTRIDSETAQLSSAGTETLFEIPNMSILADAERLSATGDTTVLPPLESDSAVARAMQAAAEATNPLPPATPAPPAAPAPQPAAAAVAVAEATPAPMAYQPAPPAPPRMPYPQQPMMYPQYMPYQMPQYYAPMMPFPQPMMYPQQPMMMPQAAPAAAPSTSGGAGVPAPPTKLPDPETTGAVAPQPAAAPAAAPIAQAEGAEGEATEKPKEEKKPAASTPSNQAADIIKNYGRPRINKSS